jgi:hypothetical protein
MVIERPVHVPKDADNETLERARQEVEDKLNRATARAELLVGRPAKAEGDGI